MKPQDRGIYIKINNYVQLPLGYATIQNLLTLTCKYMGNCVDHHHLLAKLLFVSPNKTLLPHKLLGKSPVSALLAVLLLTSNVLANFRQQLLLIYYLD